MRIKRILRFFLAMSIPTALLAAMFLQAQAGQTAVNSSRSFPLIDKLIQSDNGLSFVLNTAVLQPVANGTDRKSVV